MRLATLLIFAAFCALAAVCISENRAPNAGLPVVHAGLKDIPWRLYTLCPPNRSNVPTLPRRNYA